MSLSRRDFAKRSAYTGAGVALVGSAGVLATAPGALAAEATEAGAAGHHGHGGASLGYGPLVEDPKGILALPKGFRYKIITRTGETKLESGESTPSNHDGTATFEGSRGATLLVNNHELAGPRSGWPHPVPLIEGLVYDPAASGGCTVVEVSKHGDHVTEWVGIAGSDADEVLVTTSTYDRAALLDSYRRLARVAGLSGDLDPGSVPGSGPGRVSEGLPGGLGHAAHGA
ncbi:hypothetical protein SANTM175S_03171 [Streptomyces antimycoticus]